jgi:hypothetical protein
METEQHVAEETVIEEIKGEIKKFLESNENENTASENLWDTAKGNIHSYEFLH